MMIKKLRANWLSIALTIVVLVSLLLSGIVWTNPFQSDYFHRENGTNNQQLAAQSIGDVYLPTMIVRTNNDGDQQLLYSQHKDLIYQAKEKLASWQLGRTSTVKTNNSDVYLSYLRHHDSLMLSYPDNIPGTVFNETFKQSVDISRVKRINHIVIPLDGSRELYLLSDYHYGVYRVRIAKGDPQKIVTNMHGLTPINVDHRIVNGHAVMVYLHSFALPRLAYQISDQKISSLSANLMSTTQHANFTTHQDGNHVVYTDGTNRHLVYDSARGTVNYENEVGRSNENNINQLYSHFYHALTKTGMPLNNVRFDEVTNHGRTITYRSYVEGFPIINDDNYGGAKLQADANGVERYLMSLYTVQVPLPLDGSTVRLPSTNSVLNQLHNSSHFRDITDLRVGYEWKTEPTNHQTVKMEPTYFAKYHGKWVNYTALLK
ncbi:YycH family regulatory protein [Limosilactobacillus sp.]|uniref:YycH family regulatory protein n=1 Tax=Limosilactobacillus sp. TaxID=2773925 RepID=UPI0035A16301